MFAFVFSGTGVTTCRTGAQKQVTLCQIALGISSAAPNTMWVSLLAEQTPVGTLPAEYIVSGAAPDTVYLAYREIEAISTGEMIVPVEYKIDPQSVVTVNAPAGCVVTLWFR